MDGIRSGVCKTWKPATRGLSAIVTVISVDLVRDKALVHVVRASTGTCAPHWVDMESLSDAPQAAQPCSCMSESPRDHDAA